MKKLMKKLIIKITSIAETHFVATLIICHVLDYVLSWIATCGIIKLITICFGLTFKWSIATGIWLIIRVLKSIFSDN